MATNDYALQFLDGLERAEASLLSWGLVDGFFSEAEVENRAEEFLARLRVQGIDPGYFSGLELIEALHDEVLLWKLPSGDRYRTRMAETVRLLARLRQIFPAPRADAWRVAPSLVADYRLLLSPRVYPRRDIDVNDAIEMIRRETVISSVQEAIVRRFVHSRDSIPMQLSGFQVRATGRILRSIASERSSGTIICAGTGSGKTLAFYLPAYAAIADQLSTDHWTKCLAIYPRTELLKDQFREALANARRIAPILRGSGRRKLVLGTLYGVVPRSGDELLSAVGGGWDPKWRRVDVSGAPGFECPFIRCPNCQESMAWLDTDIRRNVEQLCCTKATCRERILPEEIRLTRERMLAEPPDVLFTTTEMINQRLASADFARLFGIGLPPERRPYLLLLDEVHSYEGVHGAHVAYLLRRWQKLSDAHPHVVGLSATLSDAPRFFVDLTGINLGNLAEISPQSTELEAEGVEYMMALRGDPSSGTSLLSTTIQAVMLLRRVLATRRGDPHFGNRVFAFTDNLDVINRLFHNLLDAEGWDSRNRPNLQRAIGSLANLRGTTLLQGHERFEAGQNWALVESIGHILAPGSRLRVGRTSSQDAGVDMSADIIVATASLEVGFDDPDVGAVLQHKAPLGAAAFLQRKGRGGRRRGMRPWTVVVLSDYGRDRYAYQAYDQLFSPYLPPQRLALTNRAVLRMQATYALLDFLALSISPNFSPDPWSDCSAPVDPTSGVWAQRARARQELYAKCLTDMLAQAKVSDQFRKFLSQSLSADDDTVTALLWEPPRALMTEVVPTLLRRLEQGWRRAQGGGYEYYVPRPARAPLPEFVPRNLFSDLNLPEIAVRIPAHGGIVAREEFMPIVQALREFAPGRVSRRFGVVHAGLKYWIDPGATDDVSIDQFCPAQSRQDLGWFQYRDNQTIREIPVFRPHAIDVTPPSPDVEESSNAFLEWHTQIVPTEIGHELDIPDPSPWRTILQSLRFHTHHLGLPIEIRRFATNVLASIGRRRGQQLERHLRFVCAAPGGGTEPAAIGFVADIDAIQVSFRYPSELFERCAANESLVWGLRPNRFRDLVLSTPGLNGLANRFQRGWLAHAYLSAVTAEAVARDRTLQAAAVSLQNGTSTISLAEVVETILQPSVDEPEDGQGDGGQGGRDTRPRRLRELLDLLHLPQTQGALHEAAMVLWEPIDRDWESWLRTRFKSTLAAALVQAAQELCPRMDLDALLIDLDASPQFDDHPRALEEDEFWLTESTIGGGGSIEEFLSRYAEDPRRYFRLADAALGPSDLEWVGTELNRVIEVVATDPPANPSLTTAFTNVRSAATYAESVQALAELRRALSSTGIRPSQALLVSLNARVLKPGTNVRGDAFLARCLQDWRTTEQQLGIEIDVRVFAFARSADSQLEQALGIVPPGQSDEANRAWRYSTLCGMLWPRGVDLRTHSLSSYNPFADLPACDRLVVLAALPNRPRRVLLSDSAWFEQLTEGLVEEGIVDLVGSLAEPVILSAALLRIACEPIDSGSLLVYGLVIGIHHDGDQLIATIELPEALQ